MIDDTSDAQDRSPVDEPSKLVDSASAAAREGYPESIELRSLQPVLPSPMPDDESEYDEEEEELEGVQRSGSYTIYTPEAEAFSRLKRRKWKWEFLAFGECGDPYRGSGYFRLMIGHTEDRQFWAVKLRSFPSMITRILKVHVPLEPHEIAETLLDSATEEFYDGVQIIHDRGEILDPPQRKRRKET